MLPLKGKVLASVGRDQRDRLKMAAGSPLKVNLQLLYFGAWLRGVLQKSHLSHCWSVA